MAVREISPQQAADFLAAGDGSVYLDVRSVEEFHRGHPRGACNIPFLHSDPKTGRRVPNPDFLRVVQAVFPRDTPLLLGCLSGGRSLRAAEELERAGYTRVANVRCGFGGSRNFFGRVTEPGWAALGLPVEKEEPPGKSYAMLLERARS